MKKTNKKIKKNKKSKRKKLINKRGGAYYTMPEIIKMCATLYRVITWPLEKLYNSPNLNVELNDYCTSLSVVDNACIDETFEDSTHQPESCCNLNGRNVSKSTVKSFNIGKSVDILKNNILFVNEFPSIQTLTRELIENYWKKNKAQIISDYINEHYDENIVEYFKETFDEESTFDKKEFIDFVIDNIEGSRISFIQKILKNFGLNDKFTAMHVTETPEDIQNHTNKVFMQEHEGNEIYYICFSFGKLLKILPYVLIDEFWEIVLEPYLVYIIDLIQNAKVTNIILYGHSVGSFCIQNVIVLLLKRSIPIDKLIIIASGCFIERSLTDKNIEIFKRGIHSQCLFILNGERREGKIGVDYSNVKREGPYIVNPINTHIILDEGLIDITGLDLEGIESEQMHSFENYAKKLVKIH